MAFTATATAETPKREDDDATKGACRFRDAFGAPGQGVHAFRVGGVAAFDVLGTLAAAAAAAWVFFRGARDRAVAFLALSTILLGASVFVHRSFCVRTTWTRAVFPRRHEAPIVVVKSS